MGAASLHEPCLYTDTRSGNKPKDETAKKTNTNFLFKLVKYELFFHKNHKTVRAQVKFMTWFIFFRLEQLAREVIVSGEQVINQKKGWCGLSLSINAVPLGLSSPGKQLEFTLSCFSRG